LPCTAADREKWGADGTANPYAPPPEPTVQGKEEPAPAEAADAGAGGDMDDIFKQMMGTSDAGAADAGTAGAPPSASPDDALFKEMMGDKH
jgi:hypothetical protein